MLEFGNIVKRSLSKQKMLAWQYNAIGVSDAITMGGEGKHLGTCPGLWFCEQAFPCIPSGFC